MVRGNGMVLWDLEKGTIKHAMIFGSDGSDESVLAVSSDGTLIATEYKDGDRWVVKIRDTQTLDIQ